jgi:hypothetical protein
VSAVVPLAPPREPVYMAAAGAEEPRTSDTPDDLDLSFDSILEIDAWEYPWIMGRFMPDGDGGVTPISAFNSSI